MPNWEYLPETKDDNAALRKPDGEYEAVFYEGDAPDKEKGDLWADALNVHESTGLTPSQLQARVAELEDALRKLLDNGTAYPSAFEADFDFDVDTWAQAACQLLGLGDHRNA